MNILGFISASVLLTLMPGPDILFVLTQGITQGKKAGIIFASGLCTGLIFHIAAVTLGVAVLLKESQTAFLALKIGGAAYLLYLGVRAFWERKRSAFRLDHQSINIRKLYGKGILMNVLNPKVILFFLAFLPQFVDTHSTNPAMQISLLGLIFIVQAFIIFSTVSILAEKILGGLMKNARTALWTNICVSLIYCGIGISILFV